MFLQASTSEGVQWLESQVQANVLDSNLSRVEQASSETYKSLNLLQSSIDISTLKQKVDDDQNTTEMLSRKIALENNATKKQQLLTKLISYKNQDGGFGELQGYNSTVLDTAFALEVLDSASAQSSVSYLFSFQQTDGSWRDGKNEPSVYVTALAMHSLWLHRNTYNVSSILESAKNYLLSQKKSNNLWDENYLSALALIAIAPTYSNNTTLLESVNAFYTLQNTNGSWDDELYTTALVLQAITKASQKVPDPDLGSISGSTFDGSSGLALVGVNVNLLGVDKNITVSTNNDGKFSFSALPNGEYTIDFSKSGFSSLQTHITFNGTNIDLGEIILNASSSMTATVLKGVVKDTTTQQPISNATVSVGTTSVQTNENGEYYISDIPSGAVTITFEANGYIINQKTIELKSGYTLIYTASLISVDSISSDIKAIATGNIIDKATLDYLQDVTVSVKTGTTLVQTLQTDAQGHFTTTALEAGNYTVIFEKNGYYSVQGSFSVTATQTINFGVVEMSVVDPNQVQLTTIQGIISDAITKAPVAEALINIGGISALSSADGSYLVENIPSGDVVITVSKTGYIDINQSATISDGSKLIFSPALIPNDQGSLKLYGTILDDNSSEPLSDVNITLQGATEATVFTDTYGNYLVEPLNSGDVTLSITKDGYDPIVLNTTITDENVEFSPSLHKKSTSTTSTIQAQVLDIATDTVLEGVSIYIDDADSGMQSDQNGSFTLSDMNLTNVSLKLKKDGYKDIEVLLAFAEPQFINLGQLKMRPITAEDLRPDILAEMINTSNLTSNPQTLKVSGSIEISLASRGAVTAQPFDLIAYFDLNADGNYTKGVDEVIATQTLSESLAPEAVSNISLDINATAHFRDQPIYVYVDAKNENVELNEENNLYSTAKSCGGKQGSIDLGVCFDYSGSVSSYMHIQKNGLISALRDPEKFPRDGSIRLTVYTGTYTPKEYLEPTIITESNADVIADKLQNSYFSGYDYMGRCLRTMADKWETLEDKSSYRAVTLSGDGVWGPNYWNVNSYVVDRNYASAHGVDVIDTIGIGSTNKSGLEAFVYPQPAGGDYGNVYYAKTSEDISNSLIHTFQKQTKVSDFTVGKLEVIDNGVDANISVKFTVGNAGVATVPIGVEIAIYEGDPKDNGVLLATTTLDQNLSFGMSKTLQVDDIALQEGGSIYVVGDSQNALVECTKQNNTINAVINATTTLGKIDPHTDKLTYGVDENVSLYANITNPGRLSYELNAQLILEDIDGNVVHTFEVKNLGVVASQEIKTISESWNTEKTLTGTYKLKG
ncbi:carboxypeptidase regulatory-like domain-containing protein, partial [Sulfurimonas sp.]